MQIPELIDLLAKSFRGPRQNTFLILGPPGAGKNAAIYEASRLADIPLIGLALPTCDPVDLRGLPSNRDGRTIWASPFDHNPDARYVLLLDEATSCPKDVQVAAHHIVWSETGSDMSLPRNVHVVLTGNRAQDKSYHQSMAAPLRNRLTIIEAQAALEPWAKWAMANNIAPEIIGFLRWRSEYLTDKTGIPAEGAFASPRAWESASHILGLSVTGAVENELLEGTVGKAAALEFVAYLRMARSLPSLEEIWKHPTKADVPKEPSVRYAITTALAIRSREIGESIMEYMARLPEEFGLLYITDVRESRAGEQLLRECPHMRKWIGKHKTLFTEI